LPPLETVPACPVRQVHMRDVRTHPRPRSQCRLARWSFDGGGYEFDGADAALYESRCRVATDEGCYRVPPARVSSLVGAIFRLRAPFREGCWRQVQPVPPRHCALRSHSIIHLSSVRGSGCKRSVPARGALTAPCSCAGGGLDTTLITSSPIKREHAGPAPQAKSPALIFTAWTCALALPLCDSRPV
jgi:hypothetical protein